MELCLFAGQVRESNSQVGLLKKNSCMRESYMNEIEGWAGTYTHVATQDGINFVAWTEAIMRVQEAIRLSGQLMRARESCIGPARATHLD